ncbi:MAG: ATP synthase F1 subunit delta [Armatimonadota bacterium]|nr:MAG: ATP synthase F1 subunit delta [Armatimonadota bacterium]
MSERRAAQRYAEALFGLARERRREGGVREELEELVALVAAAPELRSLLERPDLEANRKLEALSAGLAGQLSETVSALLATLVRHGRGDSLQGVAEDYGELADEAAGVTRAEVETAVPLSEAQRRRLVGALERVAGQRVRLEERADRAVLAGVRVRLGDKLIDGSAAGRLTRMREELMDRQGLNR